jgi:hypothetical protein
MTSARFSAALSSVPKTNPSWTESVSHDVVPADSFHSAAICGATAETPNQSPIANSSPIASSTSARVARPVSITADGIVSRRGNPPL